MKKSKITFNDKTNPIFLEVDSGYATIGSFELVLKKGSEEPFVIYPDRVKKIHDNIPDIFLIPLSPDDLLNTRLLIHGKYRPAPYHRQIRILYTFAQNGKDLVVEKKGSNVIEEVLENEVKSYYNIFQFKTKQS